MGDKIVISRQALIDAGRQGGKKTFRKVGKAGMSRISKNYWRSPAGLKRRAEAKAKNKK